MLGDLVAGLLATLGVAMAGARLLDLPPTYLIQALAVYAAAALLILATVPDRLPGSGSGAANRVTLGRLALVIPLVPLALHPAALTPSALWWIVGVGTAGMVLDGVDGWVARRTGTHSAFGARFDMETDAFLLLILSVLVVARGDVGAWILMVGGMRYLFVAAGWALPALQGDLPPSFRRKVVCVVQGVVLLVCLGPIVSAWLANAAGLVALALLTWSFGADTLWLLVGRAGVGGGSSPPPPHPPGR